MKCMRCGRRLKNPAPSGYGPKCAAAVLGVKPARARRVAKGGADVRQTDMFMEVRL
jgi:hypothetical protein